MPFSLKDENDYRISLADYSRETPNTIALALLDRVAAPELLPEMIDGPFRRYAERHSLDTDELLVDYCNEMMDNYSMVLF